MEHRNAGDYKSIYQKLLEWALSHRKTIMFLALLIFSGSLAIIPLGFVSTEFVTLADRGELVVEFETPAGTSLAKTDMIARMVEEKIMALPELQSCFVTVGGATHRAIASTRSQIVQIKLILRQGEAYRSTGEMAGIIRRFDREIPGIHLNVTIPGFIEGGRQKPIQIEVSGDRMEDFNFCSPQILEAIKGVPGVVDVESTWRAGQPEMQIAVDRLRCAALRVSVTDIGRTLRASIAGDFSNKLQAGDEEIDIRISLPESFRDRMEDLSQIGIRSLSGEIIQLSQAAKIIKDFGPADIRRKDHQRRFVVSANLIDRPLGDVSRDIRTKLDGLSLPEGITLSMGGSTEQMQETSRNLILALILSVVMVYMVMASLFESFIYPFIIMFTMPLTLVGALGALAITGKTLNLFSMIGVIMLAGVVVNNAILLIDYCNTLRKRGLKRRDALVEAGRTRLRPILMTTISLFSGMLPLALELGAGAEMRSGMAVVIMGGMLSSTLLTLIVIPVVYSIIDDVRIWVRKLFRRAAEEVNIDRLLKEEI